MIAYFSNATTETIHEPLFSERRITKYVTNGIEIHPGITVLELNRIIMRQIYGPSNTEPKLNKFAETALTFLTNFHDLRYDRYTEALFQKHVP
jgi:hypothetical protein